MWVRVGMEQQKCDNLAYFKGLRDYIKKFRKV